MQTLSSQLREHASNVPDGVANEVTESLDETAYYCEAAVATTPEGSTQQEYQLSDKYMGKAETKAGELSSKAKKHLD